jgi:hypothetical protein
MARSWERRTPSASTNCGPATPKRSGPALPSRLVCCVLTVAPSVGIRQTSLSPSIAQEQTRRSDVDKPCDKLSIGEVVVQRTLGCCTAVPSPCAQTFPILPLPARRWCISSPRTCNLVHGARGKVTAPPRLDVCLNDGNKPAARRITPRVDKVGVQT